MFDLVFLLVSLFGTCLTVTPLKETSLFKVYSLRDLEESYSGSLLNLRVDNLPIKVEYPYHGKIPKDSGGNFGDLVFNNTQNHGLLLGRDTIINDIYNQSIILVYYREFPRIYIEDFRVLNFGRERGWTQFGGFSDSPPAKVQAHILIESGKRVRMFAETYAKPPTRPIH